MVYCSIVQFYLLIVLSIVKFLIHLLFVGNLNIFKRPVEKKIESIILLKPKCSQLSYHNSTGEESRMRIDIDTK